MAQPAIKRNAPILFSLSNPTASGPQPKAPENWGEKKGTEASEETKKRKKPSAGEGQSSTANAVAALPPPTRAVAPLRAPKPSAPRKMASMPPPASPPPPPAVPPMQTHLAEPVLARQLPAGGDNYQHELVIRQFAAEEPAAFETLVGLYFQDSQAIHPWTVAKQQGTALCHGWIRNPRRMDVLAANPNDTSIDRWIVPDDVRFRAVIAEVGGRMEAFHAAILWWAKSDEPNGYRVCRVLRKAGWIPMMEMNGSPEWNVVNDIFNMIEGDEKERLVARAKEESPSLFAYCSGDIFCGRLSRKRKHDSHKDRDIIRVNYICQGQEELVNEPESKKLKSSMAGRPTQFHNVPLEERAFDSKGNRLPWALEWPDDHPNARGQKRRVEEKGPFGKANRRKGSSRTRTATPAKKENPTLDSFEKALSFDLQKSAESPPDPNLIRSQSDINIASHHTSAANKDPTQVILCGYPTNLQWQAIRTYEDISFGMICEDYEREPPAELRRYPSTITNSPRTRSRPLTKEERAMAFKYAGGANWVKVTFDSAASAERVFEASPIQIHQHWVYAQPYLGIGPDVDEPIQMTEEERVAGRPLRKHPQRGPSSQMLNTQTQNEEAQQESVSLSSSTASSGTATAPDQSSLRHRNPTQAGQHAPVIAVQNQNPRMMRYFPDQPRTVLRPAHEAFLPQPTWWERQTTWLSERGLIPGEIIGNGPPTNDNGEFDYARASFYWRFFHWIDSHFGTDYCGLRED